VKSTNIEVFVLSDTRNASCNLSGLWSASHRQRCAHSAGVTEREGSVPTELFTIAAMRVNTSSVRVTKERIHRTAFHRRRQTSVRNAERTERESLDNPATPHSSTGVAKRVGTCGRVVSASAAHRNRTTCAEWLPVNAHGKKPPVVVRLVDGSSAVSPPTSVFSSNGYARPRCRTGRAHRPDRQRPIRGRCRCRQSVCRTVALPYLRTKKIRVDIHAPGTRLRFLGVMSRLGKPRASHSSSLGRSWPPKAAAVSRASERDSTGKNGLM
jgi:hypothetical protein